MTYCSIEEAWGTNFNINPKQTNFPNLNDELANNGQLENEYQEVNYSNDTKHKKTYPKKNVYSRNMNRLTQHCGPNNRYVNNKINNKINFTNNINSNKLPNKKKVIDSSPNYLNLETPRNQYNYNMENSIFQEQINNNNYGEIIDNETYYDEEYNTTNDIKEDNFEENNYYKQEYNEENDYDKQENESNKYYKSETIESNDEQSTKNEIDKNIDSIINSKNKKTNNYEIILFIIIGIFIIFILDIFTKLGKNSKN